MKKILSENIANRVGLVEFSNTARQIMPLNHYYEKNDSYIYIPTADFGYYSGQKRYLDFSYSDLAISSNLKEPRDDDYYLDANYDDYVKSAYAGINFSGDNYWNLTNTQQGLQEVYNTFAEKDDIDITYSIGNNQDDVVIRRKPIIIMVTDGDPTVATYNYTDPVAGPHYGIGYSTAIEGYYTVLSANYFKQMVANHYETKASFYTIGMGILTRDNFTKASSDWASNVYQQTVLDPSRSNINYIKNNISASEYYGSNTLYALYNLLEQKNTYGADYSYDTHGGYSPINVPGLGYTNAYLRGIDNPYIEDYDYSNQAFFGDLTESDLDEIFDEILSKVMVDYSYSYLLKDNTDVVITDPIGDGMEVKDEPVLRYFGKNYYNPTVTTKKVDSTTSYTEYTWNATATRQTTDSKKNESSKINLSCIKARVTSATDSKGNTTQTVKFTVPEAVLPTYYPDLNKTFYYEELPVRLIYKVGLSGSEIKKLSSKSSFENAVYYTNQYNGDTGAALTTVTFYPEDSNTYYNNRTSSARTKATNVTGTSNYRLTEKVVSDSDGYLTVNQTLGNNGKLVVNKIKTKDITVNKEWTGKKESSVSVQLYGKGTVTDSTSSSSKATEFVNLLDTETLNGKNNWSYTWSNLAEKTTDGTKTYSYTSYYIREVPIQGYSAAYRDENGEILSTENLAKYLSEGTEQVMAVCVSGDTVDIINSVSKPLPYTGGIGTYWFTICGVALILSTLIVSSLIRRKRRCRYRGGDE
jgi:LPXTG-motif cell wall-anchored protein